MGFLGLQRMREERQVGFPVAGRIALQLWQTDLLYAWFFFLFFPSSIFCSIAFSVGLYLQQRRLGHVVLSLSNTTST